MRLGIRAHDTKYAPLDEMVANIHNMGFHCMHIALAKSIMWMWQSLAVI